jgi:hypothetical protein
MRSRGAQTQLTVELTPSGMHSTSERVATQLPVAINMAII